MPAISVENTFKVLDIQSSVNLRYVAVPRYLADISAIVRLPLRTNTNTLCAEECVLDFEYSIYVHIKSIQLSQSFLCIFLY